jgi:hypothetical protein
VHDQRPDSWSPTPPGDHLGICFPPPGGRGRARSR